MLVAVIGLQVLTLVLVARIDRPAAVSARLLASVLLMVLTSGQIISTSWTDQGGRSCGGSQAAVATLAARQG